MPSSTPAVQGEIFYGVKTAVPSWGFRIDGGPTVTMMQNEAAALVQAKLEEKNPGLLMDGSAYSNIYSGGAEECHFCAARMGWGDVAKKLNPLRLVVVLLLNIAAVFRVATLAVAELVLAVFDLFTGVIERGELREELMLIPARVGVSIGLREIITRGAMLDVARGLPVVHPEFPGLRRAISSARGHPPDSRTGPFTELTDASSASGVRRSVRKTANIRSGYTPTTVKKR